jgi:hypothetical protein
MFTLQCLLWILVYIIAFGTCWMLLLCNCSLTDTFGVTFDKAGIHATSHFVTLNRIWSALIFVEWISRSGATAVHVDANELFFSWFYVRVTSKKHLVTLPFNISMQLMCAFAAAFNGYLITSANVQVFDKGFGRSGLTAVAGWCRWRFLQLVTRHSHTRSIEGCFPLSDISRQLMCLFSAATARAPVRGSSSWSLFGHAKSFGGLTCNCPGLDKWFLQLGSSKALECAFTHWNFNAFGSN